MVTMNTRKYSVKHLTSLESHKLVELFNDAEYVYPWLLQVPLIHVDQERFIGRVFEVLKLSNDIMSSIAYSAELACMSQRFAHLQGKIPDKDYQEWAVKLGVSILVYKKQD